MTYEWRLNIETNRWSYEEVAAPLPDALHEFKLRVMDALDHETRLELRAHKLRQELHAEFPDALSVEEFRKRYPIDLKDIPVTHSTDPGPWPAYRFTIPDDDPEAC